MKKITAIIYNSQEYAGLKGDPLTFEDLTPEQIQSITGPQGPQGESFQPIEDVSGLVLAHTTGQDNTKAMSQKGVTDALENNLESLDVIEWVTQTYTERVTGFYCRQYADYAAYYGNSGYQIYWYQVHAGEKWMVRCGAAAPANNIEYALVSEIVTPTSGTRISGTYVNRSGNTDIEVNIQSDGYLMLSNASAPTVKKLVTHTVAEIVESKIATSLGESDTMAISQKAVTDEIDGMGLGELEVQNFDGWVSGAYVRDYTTYAQVVSVSNYRVYYWQVQAGETWVVRCEGAAQDNNVDYAILPSIPEVGSTKYYNFKKHSTDTDIEVNVTTNGYLCVSRTLGVCVSKKNVKTTIAEKAKEMDMELYVWKDMTSGESIGGYIINQYGSWESKGSFWKTIYWPVSKGDVVEVFGDENSAYAAWAFFREEPATNVNPSMYMPWSSETSGIVKITEDGYIARSSATITPYAKKLSPPDFETLQGYVSGKKYFGKTCIYIGDSIVTNDTYQWKGFLETVHGLKYVRSADGQINPGIGGTMIVPRSASDTTSIWYRCAAQRMSVYNFDTILLFGGTNDMNDTSEFNPNLIIGAYNDTPFVDDASSFATPDNYTDEWTDSLTFAQCYKGCIEMLKRDFPTKEIILSTVLPCGGHYGNWTVGQTGMIASEVIANLQVRIANEYGLKIIPMYWEVRTVAQASSLIFSRDTVHPNTPCAYRMMASTAAILGL